MTIRSILIANRGEIACRVMRTAHSMGIKTFALYTDEDKKSPHVNFADHAIKIQTNYMDMDAVINVAKSYSIDAIHPGYGFLSENASFARKVQSNKIIWIGPTPTVIKKMGDKLQAKEIAKKVNIPTLDTVEKVSKRFVSKLRSDGKIELQFGAGVSSNNDEEIIPNPSNVGNGLDRLRKNVNVDIDPSNFLYTKAYGEAPANTTLTITYTIGNGISDNIDSNTIKKIDFIEFNDDPNSTASQSMMNFVKSSVTINNETPARGGKSADSIQDIKNNAAANFATQNRLVTKQDYIVRSYSMPSKFGSVAKSYIVPDDQITQNDLEDTRIPNPLAMNLYVLGYNSSKQLTSLNTAIKNNLKTYLNYYRILTDAINIKDAFIINIGIDFEITILPNYNSNEVLLSAIDTLQKYFEIDKWQINQPIIKSEVMNTLANTDGVQSVVGLKFNNLYNTNQNYSGNIYDLETATRQGIIYPSLDPSIFELKFPKKDIKGKVTTY